MPLRIDGQRSPLVAHLRCAIELTDAEIAALCSFTSGATQVPKNEALEREGEPRQAVQVVNSGWAIRHKEVPDGGRQILDFVLPGDIVGVEGSVVRRADHTVTALTDLEVSHVPFGRIDTLVREHPRLVNALIWSAARQQAVFAEHLLSLGRRNAYARVAHLLVEVWRRLSVRGLAVDHTFRMPVTQDVLADTLGLSVVHVNRTLAQLTRNGLAEKQRDSVKIVDLPGLVDAAQFDYGYLRDAPMPDEMLRNLERRPDGPGGGALRLARSRGPAAPVGQGG